MDPSETLAHAFLKTRGFSSIRYEPDGNVPPDFLCDGRVAVEVRRLNKSHDHGTDVKGLEETDVPLRDHIKCLIHSLGPPTQGESCFVFYRFSRPVPEWNELRKLMELELKPFMAAPRPQPFDKRLRRGFEIKVIRASAIAPTFFVLGGSIDRQSHGWLIPDLEKNLKHCITEKEEKTAPFRARYPEWWLVLADRIGHGLDQSDREIFRRDVQLSHGFDKIVLLDPADHNRAFEL